MRRRLAYRVASSPPAVEVFQIFPVRSSIDGGTPVTIIVSSTVGLTSAAVGGVNLSSFAITGPTTVTGTTGPHPIGVVDVTVTGASESDPLVGEFEYVDPLDLLALNLTMRQAAGSTLVPADQVLYDDPAIGFPSFPVRLSYVWYGTASAGVSAHRYIGGLGYDFVPTVGGVPPLHTGTLGGLSTMKRLSGDSAIATGRLDFTIPGGNDAGIITGVTQGFVWVLFKSPPAITDETVLLGLGGTFDIVVRPDGVGGYQVRYYLKSYINGTSSDNDVLPISVPISLNSWMVIMIRYDGPSNTKHLRINGGQWTAGFTYNLPHADGAGPGVATGSLLSVLPVNGENADIGARTTTVSDKEADRVYLALKALYPAAGLPALGV